MIMTGAQARAYLKRRNILYNEPIPCSFDADSPWMLTVLGKPDRPFKSIPEFHIHGATEEEVLINAANKCKGYKFSTSTRP